MQRIVTMTKNANPKEYDPAKLIGDFDIQKNAFWGCIPEDRKEIVYKNSEERLKRRKLQDAYDTIIDLQFMSINQPYEDEKYCKESRNIVLKASIFAWKRGLNIPNKVITYMLDGFCKYYLNRHEKGYTLEKAFGLDGKLSANSMDEFLTTLAVIEFSSGYINGYKNGKSDVDNNIDKKYLGIDKESIIFFNPLIDIENLKNKAINYENINEYGHQTGYDLGYTVNCTSNRKQKAKSKPNLEALNLFIKKLRPSQSSRKIIKDLALERFSQ